MLKWSVKNAKCEQNNQNQKPTKSLKRKHDDGQVPFRDLSNLANYGNGSNCSSPLKPRKRKRSRSQPQEPAKVLLGRSAKRCYSPNILSIADRKDCKKVKVDNCCFPDTKSSLTLPNCTSKICTSSLPIDFPFQKNFDKKIKVEHVHDFLRQISHFTQNEDDENHDGVYEKSKIPSTCDALKLSPLVDRLTDLKFHTAISHNENKENIRSDDIGIFDDNNDVSENIDDLSLDKLVDVLLETTQKHNLKQHNQLINEENYFRNCQQINSEIGLIQGNHSSMANPIRFTKSHEQQRAQPVNFAGDISLKLMPNSSSTRATTTTTATTTATTTTSSPRSSSMASLVSSSMFTSNLHVDNQDDEPVNFDCLSLRRQKCVKRRKCLYRNSSPLSILSNATTSELAAARANAAATVEKATQTSLLSSNIISNTPKSSFLSESSSVFSNQTTNNKTSIKRCLNFLSPITTLMMDEKQKFFAGIIDLNVKFENGFLIVHVIRCKDLCRQGQLLRNGFSVINAYVKVSLSSAINEEWVRDRIHSYRTDVQKNSIRPYFDEKFRFEVNNEVLNKRLQLEVWHRDRECRKSDLLGCMSFLIKNLIKQQINGSFKLLPPSIGRYQNSPYNCNRINHSTPRRLHNQNNEMETNYNCNSSSTNNISETMESNSDLAEKKLKIEQQQKDANENLFLRYLELDPTEGPEAIPAALQRKASGNKEGKTPFTFTKRLKKSPNSGFGFTVVWTHPPHIEKIEPGLPADKAGIKPGDYIIFVDTQNVVTMAEKDILTLMKSYGDQISLEIYRRNPIKSTSESYKRRLNPDASSSTSVQLKSIPSSQLSFMPEINLLNLDQERFFDECLQYIFKCEDKFLNNLQFGVNRFVAPLSKRKDLISPNEHLVIFQNLEDILSLFEEINCEITSKNNSQPLMQYTLEIYSKNLRTINQQIKRYANGLRYANYILANKLKSQNSVFYRFLQNPTIPKKKPDIVFLLLEPLQHFRDLLNIFMNISKMLKPETQQILSSINEIVTELEKTYKEIVLHNEIMEPSNNGKPLINLCDFESRLVFTKCQPFALNKAGRKWIFGSELSRLENNSLKSYWALLFNDIILFSKISRDRVLFIIEDPLYISSITEVSVNLKKDNEFQLILSPYQSDNERSKLFCGSYLKKISKSSTKNICLTLQAKNTELKAMWQNLLKSLINKSNINMKYELEFSSNETITSNDCRYQNPQRPNSKKLIHINPQVCVAEESDKNEYLKSNEKCMLKNILKIRQSSSSLSSSYSSRSEESVFSKCQKMRDYEKKFDFNDDLWDFENFSQQFTDFNYFKGDFDSLNESLSFNHSTSTL